ncbi:GNVR domain-containing protein [Gracilimonas sp.]|uniref:GNVR domain-containing protein n=1 Tax=Gracilimonas sp. TaxID=1974203 RepID=UPI003BAA7AA0
MSENRKVDILDVATTLALRKKTIAIIVLTATVIGTILAFAWPKTYRSEVSFVVTDGNSINLSGGGLLSGLADIQMGGSSISAEQVLVLLRSTEIQDLLIEEFNLAEVYGNDIPEAQRKMFDNSIEIEDIREGGIGFNSIIALKLAHLGDDPERVYNLVKRYYEVVDSTVQRLNKKNVEDGYLLIKNRLEQNLVDMEEAEDSLVAFQSRYGILEVEEQAAAQIGAIAEVRTELVKLEIQINYLQDVLGENSSKLTDLRTQKRALERRYNNLIKGSGEGLETTDGQFDIFQPVEEMPALFVEYLRRYREVMVQEEIYKVLYPQYEQQKLSYEEATSGLMVIDNAVKPTYKHSPKRAYIMIAAFLFGCIIAFLKVFFDKWKEENPGDYERYQKFTSALSFRNADH